MDLGEGRAGWPSLAGVIRTRLYPDIYITQGSQPASRDQPSPAQPGFDLLSLSTLLLLYGFLSRVGRRVSSPEAPLLPAQHSSHRRLLIAYQPPRGRLCPLPTYLQAILQVWLHISETHHHQKQRLLGWTKRRRWHQLPRTTIPSPSKMVRQQSQE